MGISSCRTHPTHLLYRKSERVSPAECAAKKSPAMAVTAMRGELD